MQEISYGHLKSFCELMRQTEGNYWHSSIFGEVYVRNPGHHMIGLPDSENLTTFLDVANITIISFYRGQGIFTRMLDILEERENIYVENVFEQRLVRFLLRRGYTEIGQSGPFSYYKIREDHGDEEGQDAKKDS